MGKLVIRRAKQEDLESVSKIVLDNFCKEIKDNIEELEGNDSVNYDKFCNYYYDKIESNIPFAIYIAEMNDEIIGVSGGSVTEHCWTNSTWGHEDFWFVKKEYRGGRAGLLLFKKLINWFKEYKADRICMTHYTWNPKVEKFYNKMGFKPYEINYVKEIDYGS